MSTTNSLREIAFLDAYDSSERDSDIVSGFFEPALASAVKYSRLAGYFNSGMLAACARGMSSFLLGEGRMRLVCSPQLSEYDIESLQHDLAEQERFAIFESAISRGLEGLSDLEDLLESDHIEAMCWLLAKSRLEIRLAIPKNASSTELFHQKRGILEDAFGNKVSFSGSVNETHAGWSSNVEEFKVFRSWEPGQSSYLGKDEEAFLSYWQGGENLRHSTIPLQQAILDSLIERAPKNVSHIDLTSTRRKAKVSPSSQLRKLRPYQEAAVAAWNQSGRRGILQMATGAGKTLVAGHCIEQVIRETGGLVVVTAPYQHIAMQWADELSFLNPTCLWMLNGWKAEVRDSFRSLTTGLTKHIVIITVQNTAASNSFLELLSLLPENISKTLVADEAHGLGAKKMSNALSDLYNNRLGLTATPTRYFDETGSELLIEFFEGCVFEFSLEAALETQDEVGRTILCPYEYNPIFFRLSDDEVAEYRELSLRISRLSGSKDSGTRELAHRLLIKRARLVKSSPAKIPKVAEVLDGLERLDKLVIYCENLEQMSSVAQELSKRGVIYSRFSGEESIRPEKSRGGRSEREAILESFSKGTTDALVAMKCLDEGVNIPTAETAILLASSGNEKEFIQRRGRMMRQSPSTGKRKARIFDLVALPDLGTGRHDLSPEEIKIMTLEMRRIAEFARAAINSSEVEFRIRVGLEELGLSGEAAYEQG